MPENKDASNLEISEMVLAEDWPTRLRKEHLERLAYIVQTICLNHYICLPSSVLEEMASFSLYLYIQDFYYIQVSLHRYYANHIERYLLHGLFCAFRSSISSQLLHGMNC